MKVLASIAAPVLTLAGPLLAAPPAHADAGSYPIKVYFWVGGSDDPAAVTAVQRQSPHLGVARYALEQLMAGPTAPERARGLHGGLRGTLRGPSNCGHDYTVSMRHGVLTVRFCRYVNVTAGSQMTVLPQIKSTLRQFPTVRRIVLLGRDGHCTFTQKDGDDCLR